MGVAEVERERVQERRRRTVLKQAWRRVLVGVRLRDDPGRLGEPSLPLKRCWAGLVWSQSERQGRRRIYEVTWRRI